PQLRRARCRGVGIRGGPERAQAGSLHSGSAAADRAPRTDPGGAAGLPVDSAVELQGGDHGAAGGVSATGGTVHRSRARAGDSITPNAELQTMHPDSADGVSVASFRPYPLTREAPLSCRACGGGDIRIFYRVQDVPAHSCLMLSSRQEALEFPRGDIELGFCGGCGVIGNVRVDPALERYSAAYEETQAYSPRFLRFLDEVWDDQIERFELGPGMTALEIGCGKGEFLVGLCERSGCGGIGLDPGYRPERTRTSAAERITFIRDFYGPKYAHLHADYVCCRHTLSTSRRCSISCGWCARPSATGATSMSSSSCRTWSGCCSRARSGTSTTSTAPTSRAARWRASSARPASTSTGSTRPMTTSTSCWKPSPPRGPPMRCCRRRTISPPSPPSSRASSVRSASGC